MYALRNLGKGMFLPDSFDLNLGWVFGDASFPKSDSQSWPTLGLGRGFQGRWGEDTSCFCFPSNE